MPPSRPLYRRTLSDVTNLTRRSPLWCAVASAPSISLSARPTKMTPIEVRSKPGRGRGVFATATIAADTVLVRALPFALVPSDDCMLTHCCVCLSRTTRPACERCHSAVLCERCAASPGATLIHDDECAALARLTSAVDKPRTTRSLRLLLRCLSSRWRAAREPPDRQYVAADGSWWGEGDVMADEVDDIDALVGPPDDEEEEDDDERDDGNSTEGEPSSAAAHAGADDGVVEDRGDGGLGVDLIEMSKQARFYSDSRTRVAYTSGAALMGQLCCNSLTIYGQAHAGEAAREVGVAVSASVAMLNHDCTPTADWCMDSSGCLVVRTLSRVRAGDELCLSYVDTRLPAAARQAFLRRHFFFSCACTACAAGVACWACALCGHANGAFSDECEACGARKFEAPVRRKRALR